MPNVKAMVEPEYGSVVDAEIISGISRWSWRRMAAEGHIESVKISSRLLIPLSEVRRVLNEGKRPRVARAS
jgi:hypothetical protein